MGKQELFLKELEVLRKLSSCCGAVLKNSLKAWVGKKEVVQTLYLTHRRAVSSYIDGLFVFNPSFLF